MSSNRPSDESRKITYRVGWKSGTIHLQDKANEGRAPLSAGKQQDGSSAAGDKPSSRLERLLLVLLHPAPLPRPQLWQGILWALPVLVFATTCWLSFLLSANG